MRPPSRRTVDTAACSSSGGTTWRPQTRCNKCWLLSSDGAESYKDQICPFKHAAKSVLVSPQRVNQYRGQIFPIAPRPVVDFGRITPIKQSGTGRDLSSLRTQVSLA